MNKLDESKRSLDKCVLFQSSWLTPPQFEIQCGNKRKRWKQSITHLGKSMQEYALSCPAIQRAVVATDNTVEVSNNVRTNNTLNSVGTPAPQPTFQSIILANSVLAFVKAFRLKGDNESLQQRVGESFSAADVEGAKISLWEYCKLILMVPASNSIPGVRQRGAVS